MTPDGNQHKGIAMKLSTRPITSASNLVPVALATALLVFGIVMCAVAFPHSFAQSALPTSPGMHAPVKLDDCDNLLIHMTPRVELQVEREYLVYQSDLNLDGSVTPKDTLASAALRWRALKRRGAR